MVLIFKNHIGKIFCYKIHIIDKTHKIQMFDKIKVFDEIHIFDTIHIFDEIHIFDKIQINVDRKQQDHRRWLSRIGLMVDGRYTYAFVCVPGLVVVDRLWSSDMTKLIVQVQWYLDVDKLWS